MHSEVLLTARPDRSPRIECRGAVTARRTAPDTVHLVSIAFTPLGGDTVTYRVVVEPDAVLLLRSAAAAIALPGVGTTTSHTHWEIDVAGGLDVDLEPTVVAADARHLCTVALRLHDDGQCRLRERVQIGRIGEHQGFWSEALQVDHNGRPVLRHRTELGAGAVADDVLSAPRASITELRYPADSLNTTTDGGSIVLALAGGGTLSTWQGDRLIC